MRTLILGIFIALILPHLCEGQDGVGIGTVSPDSSSILEIESTEKGILIPRLSTTEMLTIASPADGLMVYNTTINSLIFMLMEDGHR
ncbi:MAG: hypothetical protein CMB80_20295 [Flammeovirgaceae bacterium]|nr:hypothetical protein [Flammeovirgaceae bacterium]MBE61017.1 hypothetical protein [Flammeovirgaceae bacterium]MBR08401.1 hypothetical protein [Rickettsiales bacterium]HCX24981.1 hypothetical protein [Cytophagales bacterium]|tara:strand:+ start:286 stop:546 length:261 start_codon:yes stop_codon:yes gene_type:complete